MKRLRVELNGEMVTVLAEKIRGELWVHLEGQTWQHISEQEGRKRSSGPKAALNPGKIISPMPGKVTKVMVGVNHNVKTGTPLVVLEAMKMEYTLSADIDGRVSQVNCRADQQVQLHQLLVEIAKEGP